MQIPEGILLLIERYLAGTATAEDMVLLNEWYHSFNDGETRLEAGESVTEQQLADRIRTRLLDGIHNDQRVVKMPYRKWKLLAASAIIILVMLSAASYWIFSSNPSGHEIAKRSPAVVRTHSDIRPGGNRAVLTLADGSAIVLDSAENGTIGQQGNIKVQKLSNGLLAYDIKGKQTTDSAAIFNTITTPRGGQYQIMLADGTKVWLNVASSIRFPVVFTGNERKVVITGEAYFEVAKNRSMPFKVEANSLEVEVLGTHFNVNAYDDEASIKTTLLEGKVKVSASARTDNNQSPKLLSPGQQADMNKEGKIRVLDNADTGVAIAWMQGYFQYKSADLKTILREIARWYDVDVEYRGNVNLHFSGRLPKNGDVSKVFEKLALTGEVHFKIDGRRIIVSR